MRDSAEDILRATLHCKENVSKYAGGGSPFFAGATNTYMTPAASKIADEAIAKARARRGFAEGGDVDGYAGGGSPFGVKNIVMYPGTDEYRRWEAGGKKPFGGIAKFPPFAEGGDVGEHQDVQPGLRRGGAVGYANGGDVTLPREVYQSLMNGVSRTGRPMMGADGHARGGEIPAYGLGGDIWGGLKEVFGGVKDVLKANPDLVAVGTSALGDLYKDYRSGKDAEKKREQEKLDYEKEKQRRQDEMQARREEFEELMRQRKAEMESLSDLRPKKKPIRPQEESYEEDYDDEPVAPVRRIPKPKIAEIPARVKPPRRGSVDAEGFSYSPKSGESDFFYRGGPIGYAEGGSTMWDAVKQLLKGIPYGGMPIGLPYGGGPGPSLGPIMSAPTDVTPYKEPSTAGDTVGTPVDVAPDKTPYEIPHNSMPGGTDNDPDKIQGHFYGGRIPAYGFGGDILNEVFGLGESKKKSDEMSKKVLRGIGGPGKYRKNLAKGGNTIADFIGGSPSGGCFGYLNENNNPTMSYTPYAEGGGIPEYGIGGWIADAAKWLGRAVIDVVNAPGNLVSGGLGKVFAPRDWQAEQDRNAENERLAKQFFKFQNPPPSTDVMVRNSLSLLPPDMRAIAEKNYDASFDPKPKV